MEFGFTQLLLVVNSVLPVSVLFLGDSSWFPHVLENLPIQGKVGRWIRAYHLKVPPPPMPPQPPRGGPRQRFLPTPRGVNMIVWSLDNRFVLAAIMGMLLHRCFS